MSETRIVAEPRDMAIMGAILAQHLPPHARIWVFGSRARGDLVRRGSDLDLAVDTGTELSIRTQALLADASSESMLPCTVDVLDLHMVSLSFRRLIEPDFVIFPLGHDPIEPGQQRIKMLADPQSRPGESADLYQAALSLTHTASKMEDHQGHQEESLFVLYTRLLKS